MKISNETVEILKNFASINMSLMIKPGSKLRTVSPQKTVLAQAVVKETFDKECALYDLNQFLSTSGMFEDPDFEFGERSVKIKNGKAYSNFAYAGVATITTPSEKEIKLPTVDVSFTIEKQVMSIALKAAGLMGLPEIALLFKDGTISVTAVDSRNAEGNSFSYPVGQTDSECSIVFKLDNLKILPRDYEVSVSSKGIAHFKSKQGDIEYWIPTEAGSKFVK